MSRPVVLSNGQMMVGLDEQGLVHDFYYPYIGLENLTTARSIHHEIGIWVDGEFSWLNSDDWSIDVDFDSNALISKIRARSDNLKVQLDFKDFVDCDHNAFIRRIKITNLSSSSRSIRIFLHQVFQISADGMQDTALFVPEDNYLYTYKGRTALLIYGQTDDGKPFDQYATGNYYADGSNGTYIDAEDGELSNNPVEHSSVDSIMRLVCDLVPNESGHVDYWIIAASSQYDCETLQKTVFLPKNAINMREKAVKNYWHKWLSTGTDKLITVDKQYLSLTKKSMMIIKAHTDKRGGILASGDSSILNNGKDYYEYCWPRDGSYAMWPLIRLGYTEEPKRFFEFCRDVMHPGGYLMHKYQPDKATGSTWHPSVHYGTKELAIQEDETAIVIYMIGEYLDYSKDIDFVKSLYLTFIQPTCNFMANFIDEATNLPHASYDLWEEKFLTSTYTTAVVENALRRGASFADAFEFPDDSVRWLEVADKIRNSFKLLFDQDRQLYRKGLYLKPDGSLDFDNTLDASSMYGVMMFSSVQESSNYSLDTANNVEKLITNLGPVGGVARYEDDWYMRIDPNQPPNPWFVCTLWLAQHYIIINEPDKAKSILDWTKNLALPSGVLSEQINPINGLPIGVAPLVWSHAEFINTILDINTV